MANILDFFRRKPKVKSNQEARNYGSALYGNTGFYGTVSNQAVSKLVAISDPALNTARLFQLLAVAVSCSSSSLRWINKSVINNITPALIAMSATLKIAKS